MADGSPTAPAIVFFDAQGRRVRAVGTSGSGPGEFRTISWFRQCAPDTLYSYDYWLRRIVVMGRNGEFVRQFLLPAHAAALGCSRSGVLAAVGGPSQMEGTSPTLRSTTGSLSLFDARGTSRAFGEVPVWDVALTDFGGWMPRLAGRIPSIAVSSDRLYVGPSDSSAITVIATDGRRLPSLVVHFRPRRPARQHIERAADFMVSLAPAGEMRDRMRKRLVGMAAAEHLLPFSTLTMDPDGVVWANLSVPGDTAAVLRALDAMGRVLGEVRIPITVTVFEIGRDYVLGASEDPTGEPVVALYRLRRGR